ncbi:arsenic resistance N-acetyltransferase ArsN2 [Halorhabdus amylolytica]|uniref:arsenic resistance N-acetyltransferase ArsN2 n=1 Tax=Halorhabdus amylolytica TaxID=2559573 RepID=UPI001B7D8BB2|nr:arsenic resistance N-acetyltransferase ArsN2 [Halorhabdus amylolytica]
MSVRPATDDERERIAALLRANDLPASDLGESPVWLFVAVDGDELLGVGGYERYGTEALLRSIVVPAEKRNQGHGSALCERLEDRLSEAGIETIFLLTTASGFFRQRGYEPVAREAIPESIQETTQFTDLCPQSATCLGRSVE